MKKVMIVGIIALMGAAAYGLITTGGAVVDSGPAPADLQQEAVRSDTDIFLYKEQSSLALSAPVAVDIIGDGTYNLPGDLTGGTIPAGTIVDSYVIHVDNMALNSIGDGLITLTGSITFDTDILGVIVTNDGLAASDGLNPGTTYQTRAGFLSALELRGVPGVTANGQKGQDEVSVNGRTLTVTLGFAEQMDELRVLVEAAELEVAVDIKPTSCPNPLNVKGGGVLPVAILGTEDFDVSQIDPASVGLAGAAPLRWDMEDVATPVADGAEDCACSTEGPDGFTDLTLKFKKADVVAAIGDVEDGEVLSLMLTGNLKEEFGGTAIAGSDCVVIIKKGE